MKKVISIFLLGGAMLWAVIGFLNVATAYEGRMTIGVWIMGHVILYFGPSGLFMGLAALVYPEGD